MKLSIIIPIYKVEKYINECLNSIYLQNINESLFEVIAVNDGTPDNSMTIVERYTRNHKNLIIINQTNKGLSEARNAGLKYAKGDYVWFVDSDDWLPEKSISILLNHTNNNYDAIKILIRRVKEKDNTFIDEKYNKYLVNKNCISGKEYLFEDGIYAPAQGIIYKRLFLQDYHLYFIPNIFHEDAELGMRALYYAKQIYLIKDICYYYRIRQEGSIMSSLKLKNFQDLLYIYNQRVIFGRDILPQDVSFWQGTSCKILYTFFYMAKSSSFETNFHNEFWNLYHTNKKIFNKSLKYIFHCKHLKKRYIKDYIIFRYIPKLYFK